ncbi:MAG: tRNA uridine(34) 5-carboxymethylaminomethyl modification radical SAM/GNAT enzyme Elp3 [Methanoculleaceae archaeon]
MDAGAICREILSRLSSENPDRARVQQLKIEVCRSHGATRVPKNSEILAVATPSERRRVERILRLKPNRTLSGVAPVAIMTSPAPCPHGRCVPCPGGPDHRSHSPQSYTGEEPAALRARQHDYDPARQVYARLRQLREIGHPVDKVDLIVMGGTMTARPPTYQREFVAAAVDAMNRFPLPPEGKPEDIESIFLRNESANVRCIGITFETRPDWCRREDIERMRMLGVTKVELGIQHVDDSILDLNRRGCTVEDGVRANRMLRDAGLKVGFHVMPNLPGATLEDDRRMFSEIFRDARFRPDFLKIYPTLITEGTEIERWWRAGDYEPYSEDDLIDLIADAKALLPRYVRLQRVQRDIPARCIVAGSRHSNFRQLARRRLEEKGGRCSCIRCREAGRCPPEARPEIRSFRYRCAGGDEIFIEAGTERSLIGFARLRIPDEPFEPALGGTAMLRELHVYGALVPLDDCPWPGEWQHSSYGERLLAAAEEYACGEGCRRIAVMSGVGVRPYYRDRGYVRAGPYMQKDLE